VSLVDRSLADPAAEDVAREVELDLGADVPAVVAAEGDHVAGGDLDRRRDALLVLVGAPGAVGVVEGEAAGGFADDLGVLSAGGDVEVGIEGHFAVGLSTYTNDSPARPSGLDPALLGAREKEEVGGCL